MERLITLDLPLLSHYYTPVRWSPMGRDTHVLLGRETSHQIYKNTSIILFVVKVQKEINWFVKINKNKLHSRHYNLARLVRIRRPGVVGRVPAFQPGGIRNFNFCPGIGCVSFVFCPVLSSAEALTLCWPHIQGGPPLCICLVFWSRDCFSPYRHRPTGIWLVSPSGCKS